MTSLAWPLERNHIRRGIKNHTFGMVRNGGARPHQGWDLYATPGTPCYAVADGKVAFAGPYRGFGNMILVEFVHRGQRLYAAYCHLSFIVVWEKDVVKRGDRIGYTGNTGNAKSMRGEDQHLHFEIRTEMFPGLGLGGRIDPSRLYGRAPRGWTFIESHEVKPYKSGLGIKLKSVNLRESSK